MLTIGVWDLWPLYAAAALGQVAASCWAAALTRRWWSGIVAWPLPFLIFVTDELALFLAFATSLIFGLPITLILAAVFRWLAEPPDRLLSPEVRGYAAVVGLIAAGAIFFLLRH